MRSKTQRNILIIAALLLIVVIGGINRFMGDATAKTIGYAKELASKGQFRDAAIVLRAARGATKSPEIIGRLDEALKDIERTKHDFKHLDKAFEASRMFEERGMIAHAIYILEQVREADLSIPDLHRVDITIAKLRAKDPVGVIIGTAKRLAGEKRYQEAVQMLDGAKQTATPVDRDRLDRAKEEIQTERTKDAAPPASSSSHSPSGSRDRAVAHMVMPEPQRGSVPVALQRESEHNSSGAGALSLRQRIAALVRNTIAFSEKEETHAGACTRD